MTTNSLDSALESRFLVLAELARSADARVLRVSPRSGGDAQILELRQTPVEAERLAAAQGILATSRHPGLASVTELAAIDGGYYWLREDLGDVTFESLMAEGGPLDVATALELLDQALDALQALHSGGFWVRNLAPSDLHLRLDEKPPRVVLADLGLGHAVGGGSVPSGTAVFVGRLRHASPEQFEDESKVSAASDLYTAGLIAFELMTGRFPIHGDTPSSLIAGHLFRPPLDFEQADPEGRVPELVRAWILARLAKNPDERGDIIGVRRALSGLRASAGPADFASARFAALRPASTAPNAAFGAVDRALESGDLKTARRLVQTLREQGAGAEVEEVARRVAAVEGFTHAADVHRLVSEAQQRLAAGAPSSAVGCLEEARQLVPDDAEVTRLLETARRTAVRSAQGRPDGPSAMLGQVQELIHQEGEARAREAEAKAQDRGARVGELLEMARARAEAEDFDAARKALDEVLAFAPDHPEALALSASIDAIGRIKREEAEQKDALERTVTDIRNLLEEGDPEQAQRDLESATDRFGDAEILETVRFDVTRARLDTEVSRTVQLSPEQLQAAIAAETAPDALTTMALSTSPPLPPPPAPPASGSGATQRIDPAALEAAKSSPVPRDEPVTRQHAALDVEPDPPAVTGDVRSVAGAGSVTLPMETIEAAKRRALELRSQAAPAALPPPGPPPVAVPPAPPHAPAPPEPSRAASSPPAVAPPKASSTSAALPRSPGPGSVTVPMDKVEAAKRRHFEREAARAARPANPPPSAAPKPSAPPASHAPPGGAAAPAEFSLDNMGFGGEGPSPSSATRSSAVHAPPRGRGAPPGHGPSRPLVALGIVVV
ncbi:MAG: hypothetical protein AAFY88_04815, partial [Acidobacteriota bacterium]